MGFDGANGIIEMEGFSTGVEPRLLINYHCGKDIFMNIGANGGNVIMTTSTIGNVGIGVGEPQTKLDIKGDVMVRANTNQNPKALIVFDEVNNKDVFRVIPFPDYVFANDYNLMSIAELDNYVTKNKHLPNLPVASEVEKKRNRRW